MFGEDSARVLGLTMVATVVMITASTIVTVTTGDTGQETDYLGMLQWFLWFASIICMLSLLWVATTVWFDMARGGGSAPASSRAIKGPAPDDPVQYLTKEDRAWLKDPLGVEKQK